jgi:hypothetical protein
MLLETAVVDVTLSYCFAMFCSSIDARESAIISTKQLHARSQASRSQVAQCVLITGCVPMK